MEILYFKIYNYFKIWSEFKIEMQILRKRISLTAIFTKHFELYRKL